jgi:hypothetical protein
MDEAGVRIVVRPRRLIDDAALREAIESGKVAGAALDAFHVEPPPAGFPLFSLDPVLATPHIAGSTEEAQEIVGVRIAEQVVEYLQSGVAINAVNMPALSPEQYRTLGPYISLAEAGQLRGPYCHRESENGAPGLPRKDRRQQHQPDPQRGSGGCAEPVAGAKGEPGECHANRIAARLEHRRAA